jgi:hypothetical protein
MEMSWSETERRQAVLRSCSLLVGAVVCVFGATLPAGAARVVDLRVGQHANFSRVVLELDSPVSYQVERNTLASGLNELVVSLAAEAQAETVESKPGVIESVEMLAGAGSRSTLRVRLKGEGLRLKEMTLSNPPRIVLDILSEVPVAEIPDTATATRPAKAAATPRVDKHVAARKQVGLSPPASRETVALESGETSERVTPPPPASRSSASLSDSMAEAGRKLRLGQRQLPPQPPRMHQTQGQPLAAHVSPAAGEPPVASRPAPKPALTARPQSRPRPSAASQTAVEGAGPFSVGNVTVGAVGLLLLVGAGLVFRRGRNAARVVGASDSENPLLEEAGPVSSLGRADGEDEEVEAETQEIPVSEAADAEVGIPIPEDNDSAGGFASLQEGTAMDLVSEQGGRSNGAATPVIVGGDDSANRVAEFERCMAAMTVRVDDLVDAKQRLERQVAAQTEELRVQRAAIARTQRAVRNLSRPGEDAPTEPALRDPSRPEGPRED